MKVCPRCKKEFEDEEFGTKIQRGKIYLKAYCKKCQAEYYKEYMKTHKRKYQYNKWEGVENGKV